MVFPPLESTAPVGLVYYRPYSLNRSYTFRDAYIIIGNAGRVGPAKVINNVKILAMFAPLFFHHLPVLIFLRSISMATDSFRFISESAITTMAHFFKSSFHHGHLSR
jgi:hypothetical protein